MIIVNGDRINRQIKKVLYGNTVNWLESMHRETSITKSPSEGDASFADQSWLGFVNRNRSKSM